MGFEFFKLANVDVNENIDSGTYCLVVNGSNVQKTKANDIAGDNTAIATSASIDSSGLISFKNQNGTTLFTLQLPLYTGTVESVSIMEESR